MIKVGRNITQSISASGTANGAAIPMSKAYTFSAETTIALGSATGVTVCLQKSNTGTTTNWVNDGAPVSVTASGTYVLEKSPPTTIFMRIAYVVGTGTISATTVLVTQEQY